MLVLFISCDNGVDNFFEEEIITNAECGNHIARLQALGFDTTNMYEWEQYYVVEEDILIHKDSLMQMGIETRHFRTNTYVNNMGIYSIGVDNTIAQNTEWRQVVQEVIRIINTNTGIRFVYRENNPQITVTRVNNLPSDVCAQAVFPTNSSAPGNRVYINYGLMYNIDTFLSFSQKVFFDVA
jgi:hypothetical protein